MRVSIIIPTLDRPLLLEAAIRSVLLQTRPVDEIIVVDDGSTRENLEANRELAALSPSIRFESLGGRRGVSAARNRGLEMATGDAVVFLDDDDLLLPGMVEAGVGVLEKDGTVDVSACLAEVLFTPAGDGPCLPVSLLFDHRLMETHPLRFGSYGTPLPRALLEERPVSALLRHSIPVHSFVARRESIGDVRFPEGIRQGEDRQFWVTLARKGCRFRLTEAVHVLIRRHGQNTTLSLVQGARDLQSFYDWVLGEPGVEDPLDRAFVRIHVAILSLRRGDGMWLQQLGWMVAHPVSSARELRQYAERFLGGRRNLLRYYLRE